MDPYYKQKRIQLFISTWINQMGELFDFNTKEFQQSNNFKTKIFTIPIPKHYNSQHYYFLHQLITTYRDEKHKFVLERRMNFQSTFVFQDYKVKNYKLIGCFKVFFKKVGKQSGNYRPFIKVLQISDIPIKKGKQQVQKIEHQKAYMVVKSFTEGYKLKVDQIVKFGKAVLAVKEIALQPNSHQIQENQILYVNQSQTQQAVKHTRKQSCQDQPSDDGSNRPTCRICYDIDSQKNPLITPCQCRGQIANIHVECLKKWLDTKLKNFKNSQDQNSHVYNTKELFCQICKEKLPKKIIIRGQQYILLNFMEQFLPYIAMQNISHATSNDLMFLTFPDCSKTTIGRLDDNGMILLQNSVSRRHAEIYMQKQKNRFVLKDTDSKYGTLVYEKDAQFRLHSNIRAIEIGSNVLSFKII